jgi:hypothetical protein
MNKNKIWLLAVMIAIVGVAVISCPPPDEDPELAGIKMNVSGEVPTGTELTADYQGTEKVAYQWNKNGTAITGENTDSYTADDEGNYTVTISFKGFSDKTSPVIKVSERAHYFGLWKSSDGDTVDISAASLVYKGDGINISYKMVDPVFTLNLTSNDTNYDTGARIRGKITDVEDGFDAPITDEGSYASEGEFGTDYWFIHTDKSKLAWGTWSKSNPQPQTGTGWIFTKQSS